MAISEKQIEKILTAIGDGESVSRLLRMEKIPWITFLETVESVPLLAKRYSRAIELRSEKFVDEIVEIADTSSDPQTARNRIEARKWVASKMQPQKYGERIDLNINQTIDIKSALNEAQNRIRDILIEPNQLTIEQQTTNTVSATGSQPVTESADLKDALAKLLE